MRKANRQPTTRAIEAVRWQRRNDKYDNISEADQAKGELLDAAIEYLKRAQDQIKRRDFSFAKSLDPAALSKWDWDWDCVGSGGTTYGYDASKRDVPDNWPFEDKYWRPGYPGHNLTRAAALIIGELERLEHQDRKIFGKPEKKKKKVEEPVAVEVDAGVYTSAGIAQLTPATPVSGINAIYHNAVNAKQLNSNTFYDPSTRSYQTILTKVGARSGP